MVLQEICPPALIYLIFSTTQVVIDTTKGYYNLAMTKMFVALIFTMLLNYLCSLGLGIISWLIVFIPFILMTLIVSMLLLRLRSSTALHDLSEGIFPVVMRQSLLVEENKDIISGRLRPSWHPLKIKTITSIKWIYVV